ncbi:MAG TPA: uridine phosphorylase [Clostridiales bacterium]|nr:uridine phosphorylase [Clostridiales bacterium]
MNESKLFHLDFDPKEHRAKYAILPGDPARVPLIAKHFDSAHQIASNREYNVYLAKAGNENVFVCSTGIGGPSAAIAVEELHMAGVDTFIRVGTSGAMQLELKGGDLVIVQSAVRQEGTSLHYAPPEYPATADFTVTKALADSAKELGLNYHMGVIQSKDSFYGQHNPQRMPVSDELLYKWNAFRKLGVLASEMECAAIFTAAASLGAKAGCVLHVIWNQEREAAGLDNPVVTNTTNAVKCAVNAVYKLVMA